MARISKRTVDAARPNSDGGRRILWDDKLAGFGLLVLPSGIKSYVFDYRNTHGIKRRITIGKVGALTPEKARAKADAYSQAVKHGGDPLAEKRERREAATVGAILDAYLESEVFKGKAASTRAVDKGRIERHLRPLLGSKVAAALSVEDIRRALAAIRDGKTAARVKTGKRGLARVTGGPGTARKAIRLLRAILAWAVEDKRLPENCSNPAAGVKLGADGERETILDNADQYAALFKTLDTMEAEQRIREPVADAIRVIAYTGARRGEIAGLRWRHVDLKAGKITLPAAAHKSGSSTGKPRIITLPAAAQAVIARQPDGKPGDYVFQPAGGNGPVNLSKPWRSVRTEAGLPDGIGLHGLRHSLASDMAMRGKQAGQIMTALGHRKMATAQKYVHWAEQARAALAEDAAATVTAGAAAASGKKPADVIDLNKAEAR